MTRPRLLDLFCGAGGAARGYQRAGFYVVGVDHVRQPRYAGEVFIQADALAFLADHASIMDFDVIHASPPCQAYSSTRTLHRAIYPELIDAVRGRLEGACVPFVIENVVGAPLRNPLMLCGSSFGLGVRRHRLFETSPMIVMRPPCDHTSQPFPIDVTGGGPTKPGRTRTNGGVSRKPRNLAEASAAMGIDWMTRAELNEAVPPAFTQFIGEQLLSAVMAA